MKAKPVIARRQAEDDIDTAVEYYLREGGSEVALAFIDAIEKAFIQIARNPAAGSPHYAHELDIPGLRHWNARKFPFLIFYVALASHIEVWRVLHGEMHIPGWIREDT